MLRKAKFTVPKYTSFVNMGLIPDEEIDVTVHGFFQTQDGDSADPVAIIELEDGRLLEVGIAKLVMTDKPVDEQPSADAIRISEAIGYLSTTLTLGYVQLRII